MGIGLNKNLNEINFIINNDDIVLYDNNKTVDFEYKIDEMKNYIYVIIKMK